MSTDLLGVVVISCKKCGKANSLDSKFCKSCGAEIVEDDLLQAKEQNEQLITDGYRLLNEGRQDEAELLAKSSVDNDPSSPTALALLGDCHERAGRYDEALLCYERVVELNPDSALDKVRVAHLRKMLTGQSLQNNQGSNRKYALFAALAAVVVVGSIGAIIALTTSSKGAAPKLVASSTNPPADRELTGFNEPTTRNTPSNSTKPPAVNEPSDGGTPEQGAVRKPAASAAPGGGRPVPSLGAGVGLPSPVANGGFVNPNEGGNVPIDPSKGFKVEPNQGNETATTPPAGNSDNIDPKVDQGSAGTLAAKPNPPEQVIDIKASGGQPKASLGGGEMDTSGGAAKADTLIRVARNQYMTGNYSGAADAYEKALRAGAPNGSTNQRLAQCYEKLGRSSDAISCYSKAAKAFESSGNGSAAAACRQAIKVLQGG